VGQIAHRTREGMHKKFVSENLKERDHSEDKGTDGKMELRETGRVVVDWMHLDQDRDQWWACEHCNETLVSIKGGKFLD
jgi:hypothetical protein